MSVYFYLWWPRVYCCVHGRRHHGQLLLGTLGWEQEDMRQDIRQHCHLKLNIRMLGCLPLIRLNVLKVNFTGL